MKTAKKKAAKEKPPLTAKDWPDAPEGGTDRPAMCLLVWYRV
jgi:hypothetical protein